MSNIYGFTASKIFDGDAWHTNAVLLVDGRQVEGIIPQNQLSPKIKTTHLGEGILAPGFIDLQVNGGGGVLLNNQPTLEAITRICATHTKFGTTSLFPTLITDTNLVRDQAIAAAVLASAQNVRGFAGLHLEGPHISVAKKGAHSAKLVRPMNDEDVACLISARAKILSLIVTVAPESVSPAQVKILTDAGIKISLGHSDAKYCQIGPLLDAGVNMFTHLYNAMSQISGREPGMVGAALNKGYASIIADGHHVHPVCIKNAVAAKSEQKAKIFLVSDSMSLVGTTLSDFELNGRKISLNDGKLALQDGTLAGSNLTMAQAVEFLIQKVRVTQSEAFRMATIYPAHAAGLDNVGCLRHGMAADFIFLNNQLEVQSTWISSHLV